VWALPRLQGELIERVSEIPGEGTDIWLSASIRVSLSEFAVDPNGAELVGRTVREAEVARGCVLTLELDDGTRIRAPGAAEVESWEIVGPEGMIAVAPAGDDEPTIW
jgi:Family of unknown function (DUF6188)